MHPRGRGRPRKHGERRGRARRRPPGACAWRREAPLDFKKSGVVTLGPLEIKTFVLEVTKLRNES